MVTSQGMYLKAYLFSFDVLFKISYELAGVTFYVCARAPKGESAVLFNITDNLITEKCLLQSLMDV